MATSSFNDSCASVINWPHPYVPITKDRQTRKNVARVIGTGPPRVDTLAFRPRHSIRRRLDSQRGALLDDFLFDDHEVTAPLAGHRVVARDLIVGDGLNC